VLMKQKIKSILLYGSIILLSCWIIFNLYSLYFIVTELELTQIVIVGITISFLIAVTISSIAIKEIYRVVKGANKIKNEHQDYWFIRYWKASKLLTLLFVWLMFNIFYFSSYTSLIDLLILGVIFYIKTNYPSEFTNEVKKK